MDQLKGNPCARRRNWSALWGHYHSLLRTGAACTAPHHGMNAARRVTLYCQLAPSTFSGVPVSQRLTNPNVIAWQGAWWFGSWLPKARRGSPPAHPLPFATIIPIYIQSHPDVPGQQRYIEGQRTLATSTTGSRHWQAKLELQLEAVSWWAPWLNLSRLRGSWGGGGGKRGGLISTDLPQLKPPAPFLVNFSYAAGFQYRVHKSERPPSAMSYM